MVTQMLESGPLTLEVTDVSGQKVVEARDVPLDCTVDELIKGCLPTLDLPRTTAAGEPVSYQARLEPEGRHLHASERVGSTLRTSDRVRLLPNVDAG